MKLISMTDFILEQRMTTEQVNISSFQQIQNHISNYYDIVYAYAQFLKQPLNLGMFLPCDEDGKIWKYPPTKEEMKWAKNDSIEAEQSFKQKEFCYKKAKERVLFEGFELVEKREVYDSINGIIIDLDTQTFQIESSLGVGGGYLIDETIEYLATLDLKLTENAIKQIF